MDFPRGSQLYRAWKRHWNWSSNFSITTGKRNEIRLPIHRGSNHFFEVSMSIVRSRLLTIPILCGSLATILFAQAPGAGTGKSTPPPPPAPPNLAAVYPQIVRISYLEGDVRIARGAESENVTTAPWERAVAGLPLASHDKLVTGAGRVEIEFEDASTIYLAPDSVLTLDDLITLGGVPHSELWLLGGTATLHLRPIASESFIVKTPTDGLTTAYPGKAYLRITSYADAIAITPQKDEGYQLDAPGSAEQKAAKGQTQFFNNGKTVTLPAQSEPDDFAAWDSWVATRVTQRSAAMKAVMKSAGLTVPLPGLADLNGRGTFSPCAPYGICWDPPADPNQQPAASQLPGAPQQPDFSLALTPASVDLKPGQQVTVNLSLTDRNGFSGAVDLTSSLPDGFICPSCSGQIAQGQVLPLLLMADLTVQDGTYVIPFTATYGTLTRQASLTVNVYTTVPPSVALDAAPAAVVAFASPIFPCFPGGVAMMTAEDIRIGRGTYLVPVSDPPYAWVVCHAGSWIYRQNHYVWVVGGRKHHHRPIHWIKNKHTTGYVPIHPRDVAGKPPVNRKHDVYALSDKKGTTIERTQFDPKGKIELLKEPPKGFRTAYLPPLARADELQVVTHTMLDKQTGIALRFDNKSQNFEMATGSTAGDKKTREFSPFTGHNSNLRVGSSGNIQARGGMATHISTHAGGIHAGGAAHAGAAHAGGAHAGAAHIGGARGAGGHSGGGGHAAGGGHAGGGHR